jgi:hypothetical protein
MPVHGTSTCRRTLITKELKSRLWKTKCEKRILREGLSRGVPEMCKWNVFTIDREMGLCNDEASP